MIKATLILCLILTTTFISHAERSIFDGLDYYRVYSNYFGSAYNGSSILIYGDGGVIVRSSDGGNTWQQVNLDESYKILDITNIGREYFGIFDKKYVIKSTNDGINWQQFDFGDITDFYKIESYDGNLYCMSSSRIIICNTNIEKIKEYPVETDTAYYNFTISENNLIYSAGHGKLGIIDLQSENIVFINLKDMGICTDCPIIKNIFSDANITYFKMNNDLFQYDGSQVKQIYSRNSYSNYDAINGNVYEILIQTAENLDSLYFIRIDKDNKSAIQIKEPGNDRYISNLHFESLNILSKDTIIAVGRERLIYMSYNGGINWQLKSHFEYSGNLFLTDREHAYCIEKYAKFIKTSDGGIT